LLCLGVEVCVEGKLTCFVLLWRDLGELKKV
jgi:hypothetical protein